MSHHPEKLPTNRRTFLAAAFAATAAGALTATTAKAQGVGPGQPEQIIEDWPETAKKAALFVFRLVLPISRGLNIV